MASNRFSSDLYPLHHCIITTASLLKIWMNMNGEYENATSWPNWIQFKQDLRLDDKNFRESWKNRRKISGKCFFSKKWTSLEFGCWHGRSLTQHKICKENSNKVVVEGKGGAVCVILHYLLCCSFTILSNFPPNPRQPILFIWFVLVVVVDFPASTIFLWCALFLICLFVCDKKWSSSRTGQQWSEAQAL